MSAPAIDPARHVPKPPPAAWKRYGIVLVLLGLAAFWVWALFFASKEAVNRIGDRAWADRAEQICADVNERREELADYTRIDVGDASLIERRADIVDQATDLLDEMLIELAAEQPNDAKGAAIVPDWLADYHTYVADRRNYADELRRTGDNSPFYETAEQGIPLSERIATFAGDNEMASCAPPRDLS